MRKPPQFLSLYWLLSMTFLLAFQACKQDIKEPIDRFQKSTTVAVAAIGNYYKELNSYERKLYFQELALDPTQRLLATDSEGVKTPFLHDPFGATGIQARLALLRQLGTYAERLTTLAGNTSPERFQTNVTSLASSLTALQGTFTSLSLTAGNADASRYIGPLSTIAGTLGRLALAKKRNEALREAIVQSEQPVNELLSFLEKDLDKYVSATRITGAEKQLSNLSLLYNSERSKLSLEQRQQRLDEISRLAEEYKLLQDVRPPDVVKQMKIAHETLLQAVRSNNPLSIGLVLGAIEDYEATVINLVDAVRELHQLTPSPK